MASLVLEFNFYGIIGFGVQFLITKQSCNLRSGAIILVLAGVELIIKRVE